MQPFLPGDVIELTQDRGGELIASLYICVEYHHSLYLSTQQDEPFYHSAGVTIESNDNEWLSCDLFVELNVLHQLTIRGRCLGALRQRDRLRIADAASGSKALLEQERVVIVERFTQPPDTFYDDQEDTADVLD